MGRCSTYLEASFSFYALFGRIQKSILSPKLHGSHFKTISKGLETAATARRVPPLLNGLSATGGSGGLLGTCLISCFCFSKYIGSDSCYVYSL
jgi:hypothetical protein